MKQPAHQYYSSSSCQSQTVNSLERKPDKIDVSAAPKCIKSLQIEEARAPMAGDENGANSIIIIITMTILMVLSPWFI